MPSLGKQPHQHDLEWCMSTAPFVPRRKLILESGMGWGRRVQMSKGMFQKPARQGSAPWGNGVCSHSPGQQQHFRSWELEKKETRSRAGKGLKGRSRLELEGQMSISHDKRGRETCLKHSHNVERVHACSIGLHCWNESDHPFHDSRLIHTIEFLLSWLSLVEHKNSWDYFTTGPVPHARFAVTLLINGTMKGQKKKKMVMEGAPIT